tara:strand:+ start:292 stop:522 length:231 start_codon:yes stop_codon:yes gene_type:complete
MKKKNILMATYTLTIYAIVVFAMLTSCKSRSQRNAEAKANQRGIEVNEFKVVDVNGDTITVHMSNNGGIPSSAYKK